MSLKVALEWLLLPWKLRRSDFNRAVQEPHIQTWPHPCRNISKRNPLVDAVLVEAHTAAPSIIQDAQLGNFVFAFTAITEDGTGLLALLIDRN